MAEERGDDAANGCRADRNQGGSEVLAAAADIEFNMSIGCRTSLA